MAQEYIGAIQFSLSDSQSAAGAYIPLESGKLDVASAKRIQALTGIDPQEATRVHPLFIIQNAPPILSSLWHLDQIQTNLSHQAKYDPIATVHHSWRDRITDFFKKIAAIFSDKTDPFSQKICDETARMDHAQQQLRTHIHGLESGTLPIVTRLNTALSLISSTFATPTPSEITSKSAVADVQRPSPAELTPPAAIADAQMPSPAELAPLSAVADLQIPTAPELAAKTTGINLQIPTPLELTPKSAVINLELTAPQALTPKASIMDQPKPAATNKNTKPIKKQNNKISVRRKKRFRLTDFTQKIAPQKTSSKQNESKPTPPVPTNAPPRTPAQKISAQNSVQLQNQSPDRAIDIADEPNETEGGDAVFLNGIFILLNTQKFLINLTKNIQEILTLCQGITYVYDTLQRKMRAVHTEYQCLTYELLSPLSEAITPKNASSTKPLNLTQIAESFDQRRQEFEAALSDSQSLHFLETAMQGRVETFPLRLITLKKSVEALESEADKLNQLSEALQTACKTSPLEILSKQIPPLQQWAQQTVHPLLPEMLDQLYKLKEKEDVFTYFNESTQTSIAKSIEATKHLGPMLFESLSDQLSTASKFSKQTDIH